MERVSRLMRLHHHSYETEKAYNDWIRRYIRFQRMRHPGEMGPADLEAFLNHLATQRRVSASTQTQALGALLFLYKRVLEQGLPWFGNIVRARRPIRVPTVPSHGEVGRI